MALAARIHRAARGHDRTFVDIAGTLRDSASTAMDVVIEDVSLTGFRIQPGPDLTIGESISLGVSGMGVRAAEVIRQGAYGYGCEFSYPLAVAELDAVLAGKSVDPIPFPRVLAAVAVPPAQDRYPRKLRMLGALGLAAASWVFVGLAIKALM